MRPTGGKGCRDKALKNIEAFYMGGILHWGEDLTVMWR